MAEKGITHHRYLKEFLHDNAADLEHIFSQPAEKRVAQGFPAEGLGQSDLAKYWEAKADTAVSPSLASAHQTYGPGMPEWLAKVAPDETVYSLPTAALGMLGHDALAQAFRTGMTDKTLPPNLQLTPERLKGMGMEKAVVYSDNMRRFKQLQEEKALRESSSKMPVLKEYPDGYKWIEITRPQGVPLNQADKMVEDLLKYDGKKMNHCVGDYCEDVLSGNTRVMSLRGPDGAPHITVEGLPTPDGIFIEQIKGSNNLTPKEEYLPYARDFFKSQVPGPYKFAAVDNTWGGARDYSNLGFVHPNVIRNLQSRLSSKGMQFDYGGRFRPPPRFELYPAVAYTRDELAELITRKRPEGVDPNFGTAFINRLWTKSSNLIILAGV